MSQTVATSSDWGRVQARPGFRTMVFAILLVLLVAAFIYGVGTGSIPLSPEQVLQGIFGPDDYEWHRVVWDIRLPRVLLAAMVGANLATSGVILQAIMGNPLADPGIIGVSSGAGLFGIIILLAFPSMYLMVPLFAFVGAMLACIVIYVLAWKGGIQPMRIILAGVAVAAFFSAIQTFVQQRFDDSLLAVYTWILGRLSTNGWSDIVTIAPYVVLSWVVLLLHRRVLDVLALGDVEAASLGINVPRVRLVLVLTATLGTTAVVSVSGLIGFVGIVVPHAMRLIFGSSYRLLLPLSMLFGAAFLVLTDVAARSLIAPAELPIGVVTALLGAPFFLVVLRRGRAIS